MSDQMTMLLERNEQGYPELTVHYVIEKKLKSSHVHHR